MSSLSLKPHDQNEYEITNSCIADFNKLSQQRQIKILKQLSINARSFVQYVCNEKRSLFSDIKQLVNDSIREREMQESNAKQMEHKYGDIIQELYVQNIPVKTIAINLAILDQAENADSKLKISESIVRTVINSMNIQRANDRKKGKQKANKKNVKRSARMKANTQQIEIADTEQIEIADVRQIEKQIDPEIDNVRLENLSNDSES